MPRVHRRHLLFAGLMIAGTGAPAATAQEVPAAPAPLPAPTLPGAVTEGVFPAGPVDSPPPAVPPAGTCTCGNRHGLSRWRWHRTQCKRHLQEHFLGYAEEFNEWPLGEALYAHGRAQVANGLAARMVFYHYDFVDGTDQLNVRGRDKLAAVAATLPTTFFPVVVERSPVTPGLDQSKTAVLDQQRRTTLLTQLAHNTFPVPAERVVIGPSIAYGMTGFEAVNVIYPRQLSNLASGGSLGAAGAGAAGFDAGGLSGSAVAGGGAAGEQSVVGRSVARFHEWSVVLNSGQFRSVVRLQVRGAGGPATAKLTEIPSG